MTHTCYKNNNNVTKPKHCLQTGNHTMLQMLQMLQVFWKLEMKKCSTGKLNFENHSTTHERSPEIFQTGAIFARF